MGGGKGGGSSSTVEKASPLVELQAQFAEQIAPFLRDYVIKGMSGFPTAGQVQGTNLGMNMMKSNAGTMGISPGDPSIMEAFRKMTENLTKPNPDVLNTAISLYTGAPTLGGSSTTTTDPGAMGALGGLANLGMSGAMIARLLGSTGAAAAPSLMGAGAMSALTAGATSALEASPALLPFLVGL